MEWIYDDLYEPYFEGKKPELAVIEAEMGDNPFISEKARNRILAMFGEDERLMREKGKYTTVSGQLFKLFSDKYSDVGGNVVPVGSFDPHAPGITVYVTGDHGYNEPTAWLWVAVDRNGSITVFHEHYQREMIVADHAAAIHAFNDEFKIKPYFYCGDPAMAQRQGVTGDSILQEYSRHGIEIQTKGITRDKLVGINKINSYLRASPKRDGLPYLLVTDNCPNTIRELKGAKRARIINKMTASRKNQPEGMLEKDDHAIDPLRYLFTLLPDLSTPEFAGEKGLNAFEAGMIPEYRDTYEPFDPGPKKKYNTGWSSLDSDNLGWE